MRLVRLHFPFHGVLINERIPVASSDKVLFRCPVCERTFRVPVAYADRMRCPECEKLAQQKAEEDKEEQRQRQIEQILEKSPSTQSQRSKRGLFGRLYNGWRSMREQQKRTAEVEQWQRQRDRDERLARESQKPPTLRLYAGLDAIRSVMFVGSGIGVVVGGLATIAGLASTTEGQFVTGLILLASSVGGLTSAELIALAINVAKDIEQSKNHAATLEQYFRYVSAREKEK